MNHPGVIEQKKVVRTLECTGSWPEIQGPWEFRRYSWGLK